ncbi:proprotein convertase P-domain-containing protein [Polaribacter sp. MSW13]|uniref:Proprotein convertase P-domain-containing protein n=1 Tax=Polaribacter marinus TaxID=2916838 RepID=A0A9X1VP50_9FLAO|nr:proprotein convertase P-domain-containing protein [Polaribacter marinus]MCI2229208.1 proprotein convertase P-domain-containing protein [Polaribacter marinus]
MFFLISINSFAQNTCTDYSENPGTTISSSGTNTYNTIINVPDSYILSDVNITVNIIHTYNADLDIYLISPLGTRVELATDKGGGGDNYSNVTFNDASSNTLPNGTLTISGDYKPEGSLADFNGQNANGNWTLEVSDDANLDGGTINNIILNLCYLTPVSGLDGHLGPGGVGDTDGASSLKFWIRTDKGVSTTGTLIDGITNSAGVSALDISETGTQRPSLVNSAINGYDEISFSGSNRLRTGLTLTTNNFVTNQASTFIVTRADNTSQNTSVYLTDPLTSNRFSNHLPWNGTVYYDFGNCCGTNSRIQVGSLTGLTSYSLWTYDANTTDGKQLYRNGSLLQNEAGISSYTSHATQRFNLGANTTGSAGFKGDVSEVVLFKNKLNTAERIIVDNYLSAKFGLTLNVNNYYNEDDLVNGNFDHKVAGIGQSLDGSAHLDSQGTGIIRINTPSSLSPDKFLFWGEDVKEANYSFSSSASTDYLERLDTKWRVSKRNDLGTVSLSLKASDLTFNSSNGCNDLKLIVSSTSDFLSKTTYDLVLSGGVYTATEVSFSDNDYFTFEYVDTIVLDGTTAYNGSSSGKPNSSDGCYKLLVKNTSLELLETANVREVEVEPGAKLVVNSELGLTVSKGIQLDGDIRLIDGAQLIQQHTGTSLITGTGKLFVDQNSEVKSKYLYNYFASPVVTIGESTYKVASVMKDGTSPTSSNSIPLAINFIGGYDGNFSNSPIELPDYWVYTYDDLGGGDYGYDNNSGNGSVIEISPGKSYLFKGPGREQNYTFEGTPNDGDYTYTGVPADVSILVGNPYPSAFNIQTFLSDNSSIGTTAYLYQHVGVENSEGIFGHYKSGYVGGYATINSATSAEATAPSKAEYIKEAESATLGGNALIVGNTVELKTATDSISFIFNGLSKSVDSLFIVYRSSVSKNLDLDINGISELTNVSFSNTLNVIDTLKLELAINVNDTILLKSKNTNTIAIDKVYVSQKFSYEVPPFNYLAIAQGFFFSTDTAGDLVFNNGQRVYIPEGTNDSFFFRNEDNRVVNNSLPVLKLGMDYSPIENQTFHRQIAVSFIKENSFSYDRGYDSEMADKGETDIYWKFPGDDSDYVISGVQNIDETLEVPFELVLKNDQSISLNIDELQNISHDVFLRDKETGIDYNLTANSLKIKLESGTYTNRFYIVFKESVLAVEENELTNSFLVYHNRNLKEVIIKNNSKATINKVTIYNVLGQKIVQVDDVEVLSKPEIILKTTQLKQVVYIVNIETNKGEISKKFF